MLQNDIRHADAVRHVSVDAGTRTADRADSHGQRPQNGTQAEWRSLRWDYPARRSTNRSTHGGRQYPMTVTQRDTINIRRS